MNLWETQFNLYQQLHLNKTIYEKTTKPIKSKFNCQFYIIIELFSFFFVKLNHLLKCEYGTDAQSLSLSLSFFYMLRLLHIMGWLGFLSFFSHITFNSWNFCGPFFLKMCWDIIWPSLVRRHHLYIRTTLFFSY